MRQEIINLYDDYTHERIGRRAFMDRLTVLAGGTAAASALLPMLKNNYAKAAVVAADDPRLQTGQVTFPGASGEMQSYLAQPADAAGPLPGVVVLHENRGLTPYIEDVARRLAVDGFVALAPDFLSPLGGTPDDEDQARELQRQLDSQQMIQNALAAIDFLEAHEATTDQVGVVGFCAGGSLAGRVAVSSSQPDAVVVFYGGQPPSDEVSKIQAPLLLHYAGLDERINAGIPEFEQALNDAGVEYTMHMYEGVNHAFHNDTSEARFDQEAAELAWSRTIEFFKQHLAG